MRFDGVRYKAEARTAELETGDAVSIDPIDAIEAMLAARGWSRRHLGPALGSSGRICDIMNRRRPLSVGMIRVLVINYGMDAKTMIRWYPTATQPVEPVNVFEEIARAAASPERLGNRSASPSDGNQREP